MKIGEIKLKTIEPEAGMVLTNGDVYKDGIVYLGCNDKPDNWDEITVAEYETIKEEMEKQEEIIAEQ